MLSRLRILCARLKDLFRQRKADRDFNNELEMHLQLLTERYIQQGMSPQEAISAARRQFGNVPLLQQRQRELRTFLSPSTIWRDLIYTLRRISKAPVVATAVVISIGLGIGANATIFSILSRFILQPPPVGDPGRLMSLHVTHDHEVCCNSFSWPLFQDLQEQSKTFSGLAAYIDLLPASIGGSGEPERVWGQATTTNYFDVAQLQMTLGRGFASSENRLPVIVLGHGLWQNRFASDSAIVGKVINLSGHPFTVVGVASPGFRGLDSVLAPEFWVPLGMLEQLTPKAPDWNTREQHWLQVVGRLAPGVTEEQVRAELRIVAERLAKAFAQSDKDGSFRFERAGSLPPRDSASIKLFLTILSLVVLLVLGIAGTNMANLLLAQAVGRQREMAVRIAMGATRMQLLRQLLLESVLLSLCGGVFGVALALWATRALSVFHVPAPVPLDLSISVDWRVLLYAFALSVGAGLLFGMLPALLASHPLLSHALKGEDPLARSGRRWALRNVLVVVQITMSFVLLCVTGLFLRSLEKAAEINVGFRSRGVLMMAVDPQTHRYTPERTVQFLTQVRQRIATLPGVLSVACTDGVPLSGGHRSDGFAIKAGAKSAESTAGVELYMVTPGYFETMGIARIAGGDLTTERTTGPKLAVVNQVFVNRVLNGENPIGQQVSGGGVTYQVIGVVQNTKSRTIGEAPRPVLYRALSQNVADDPSGMGYSFLVRYEGDSGNIANAVRRQIHSFDPSIAIFNTATMEEHLRDAFFLPRLAGTLFGVFGFTGLILAAVGLYGVMSYSVSRRTREIGIRMALGAQVGKVQGLILRQGLSFTLIAIGLGLPIALITAKFFGSFLYGVPPHDGITFTMVPLFLIDIAMLACWVPSRRAAKVDPQRVLRYE